MDVFHHALQIYGIQNDETCAKKKSFFRRNHFGIILKRQSKQQYQNNVRVQHGVYLFINLHEQDIAQIMNLTCTLSSLLQLMKLII